MPKQKPALARQRTKIPVYFERALFLVAVQDSGKSSTLRSMFLDHRLGRRGIVPNSTTPIPDSYQLGNERRLHIRLTSPHEYGDTPTQFHRKISKKLSPGGRWNFVCPLHPYSFKNMPDVVRCVELFIKKFQPERVKIVFLEPNRHGQGIKPLKGRDFTDELLRLGVEVATVDGRQRKVNGLQLADFFDFT